MYQNYNDIYKKRNSNCGNADDMMYYPNLEYIRRIDDNMNNYQYNNPYIMNHMDNQTGHMNVNTMQMRNNILRNQYPAIYNDINKLIDEIMPSYRNTSMADDIVEEMTDKIYTSYITKADDKTNSDVRNMDEKQKQERNISQNVSQVDKRNMNNIESRNNNILRDLVKILLITRLIKFNLDNTSMHTHMHHRYTPYDFEMRSGYMTNDVDSMYMGYRPRNYF